MSTNSTSVSAGAAIVVLAGIAAVVLGWVAFSAAITAYVNLWAAGKGGFFIVWLANIGLTVAWTCVHIGFNLFSEAVTE